MILKKRVLTLMFGERAPLFPRLAKLSKVLKGDRGESKKEKTDSFKGVFVPSFRGVLLPSARGKRFDSLRGVLGAWAPGLSFLIPLLGLDILHF